jgi:hypothetical protein
MLHLTNLKYINLIGHGKYKLNKTLTKISFINSLVSKNPYYFLKYQNILNIKKLSNTSHFNSITTVQKLNNLGYSFNSISFLKTETPLSIYPIDKPTTQLPVVNNYNKLAHKIVLSNITSFKQMYKKSFTRKIGVAQKEIYLLFLCEYIIYSKILVYF